MQWFCMIFIRNGQLPWWQKWQWGLPSDNKSPSTPHDTYIEGFLGTGAVMKRKAPVLRNIGLDLKFNYKRITQ